jgi:YspA, cpYpsA-related SLOG family
MRVLVCGGRNFTNTKLIYKTLDDLIKAENVDCIIEGDARGADRIAGYWAKKNRIDLYLFKADWERYGKSAGYRRNYQMLIQGLPDVVIAFPGGKGTANMVQLAKKEGFKVIEIADSSGY